MKTALVLFFLFVSTLFGETKAIVFDFGGVLTNKLKKEILVHFVTKTLHLSKDEFLDLNNKRKASSLSDLEFWKNCAKEKNISLPSTFEEDYFFALKSALNVNPSMYSLIETLQKENYPVALLSNVDASHAKCIKECGLYDPFIFCILSCEVGIEKPDAKIYKILLDKLPYKPEEILFIDDKKENVEAAKKLGIDAVRFVSEPLLKKELKKRHVL